MYIATGRGPSTKPWGIPVERQMFVLGMTLSVASHVHLSTHQVYSDNSDSSDPNSENIYLSFLEDAEKIRFLFLANTFLIAVMTAVTDFLTFSRYWFS